MLHPTMLLKILCLRNQVVSIYVLRIFNPEHIMESLFLENRCQDSRRRSFWSQRDIPGRAMAKHCSFKCLHVLAVYDNLYR